jgi:hypothetical protein
MKRYIQVGTKRLYDGQRVSGKMSGVLFTDAVVYIISEEDKEYPCKICEFYLYQDVHNGFTPRVHNEKLKKKYMYTYVSSLDTREDGSVFSCSLEIDGYSLNECYPQGKDSKEVEKSKPMDDSITICGMTVYDFVSQEEYNPVSQFVPHFKIKPKFQIDES